MKGIGRFLGISAGGILALLVMGMVASAIFDVDRAEIESVDLIGDWMWFRIGFYVAVIAAWLPICRYMTRPGIQTKKLTEEERQELSGKRDRDIEYLKSQWWKAALVFVFFEAVIIQQFGL